MTYSKRQKRNYLNCVNLKDSADVFVKVFYQPSMHVQVTITRGDRMHAKVYRPTPASMGRINNLLLNHYWPTADVLTPNGWHGYSNR